MKVSIIIVTYNTKDLTSACINSVVKFTENIDYEIILVDNASTDGSKVYFENNTLIQYIYSPENLGFGRANNLGAKTATGDFLFFLNSDTVFKENSVEKLHHFFTENEETLKIGSLGCTLINNEGQFNGDGSVMPSCKTEIEKHKSVIPLIKYFAKKESQQERNTEKNFYEIGYVIGADLMMRAEVFKQLNGFDPAFFMYYEESDLQFRLKNLGLKCFIYSGTEIIHLEDGSGKAIRRYNNRKRIIVHTSKNIFLRKNDPDNFGAYKYWDKFYLYLSGFSKNYTKEEKAEFETAVRKTY
ncbi:glycosyltransferase family 2 protein [Halpernia frigidisoli]|uniref:Glycosyltransferase, GT2 family n=1 Tax=Halpernia frigidisoli TaxID=1125876 RepID=A0A1I3FDE1_9FLAO|nr:glycosyltransferase family 2 protein [Halpernia frigidisoli]SFI09152.1 Glycosyltransferase, GT2 family [Halpernia frigidisoli]